MVEYTLRITMADPAGNRTALVEGEVPPGVYGAVAAKLLEDETLRAEQVGFVCPAKGKHALARLEMMGGEFCGNASRSFGLWVAHTRGLAQTEIPIEISGASNALTVSLREDGAWVQMPLPQGVSTLSLPGLPELSLVDLGGIGQVIVQDLPPQEDLARAVIRAVYQRTGLPAVGVLFCQGGYMTPLVWVRDTDSLVWEGSCGSGTLAVAVYQSRSCPDGITDLSLRQPGGTLSVQVRREGGQVVRTMLGGPVSLEPPVERVVSIP